MTFIIILCSSNYLNTSINESRHTGMNVPHMKAINIDVICNFVDNLKIWLVVDSIECIIHKID